MNLQTTLKPATVSLYRPIGPGQLRAIESTNWQRFPPRLPGQKYFYPLLHESFAHRIAREWHLDRSGAGFVTEFMVDREYLEEFSVFVVGGPEHKEYRIPARELSRFNDNIVGDINLVARYYETPVVAGAGGRTPAYG